MIKKLKRFSDLVDQVSMAIAALMVLLILLISIYGAILRYIFNNPLPWPLPVERILMIWSASLGIAAALKRGQHMGVEGLITLCPRKVEVAVRYAGIGMIAVFVICLFWFGMFEVAGNSDLYMISAKTRISSKWLVAAIPVSALIQIIHLFTAPLIVQEGMKQRLVGKEN